MRWLVYFGIALVAMFVVISLIGRDIRADFHSVPEAITESKTPTPAATGTTWTPQIAKSTPAAKELILGPGHRNGAPQGLPTIPPPITTPGNRGTYIPQASPSPRSAIDDDPLPIGRVHVHAPQVGQVNESEQVSLYIGATEAILRASDMEGSPLPLPQGNEVRVGGEMSAHLNGAPDFDVTPQQDDKQPVSFEAKTASVWRWGVTPRHSGRHRLTLSIDATYRDHLYRRVKDINIDVRVSRINAISEWAGKNRDWLQWAWTALLVPLAAAAASLWRKWRDQPQTPAARRRGKRRGR